MKTIDDALEVRGRIFGVRVPSDDRSDVGADQGEPRDVAVEPVGGCFRRRGRRAGVTGTRMGP